MGRTMTRQASGERPVLTKATRALLACGIISSALYVLTDIIASASWDAYSYTSQMISELIAIGAPTRPAMIAMSMVYNPLVFAFGLGVWRVAHKRSLRIAGALLMAYGVISFVGPFVPMHQRGAEGSLTDVLHIVCTVGIVLSTLLFIAFGSGASGRPFRGFSIASFAAIVFGGVMAGMAGQGMAAGEPTPWFGLLERVNIYAIMLWILMLGAVLLHNGRDEAESERRPASHFDAALAGRQ